MWLLWTLILGPVAVAGIFYAFGWGCRVLDRETVNLRELRAKRVQRLIDNATNEHRLVQRGDVAGIYGDFPVPPEVKGMGIWLTDK